MVLGATPSGAPGGATEHGFVGALDHISVWTGALTPSEIQADYVDTLPSNLSIRVSQVELCFETATNVAYQLKYRSELTTNFWVLATT